MEEPGKAGTAIIRFTERMEVLSSAPMNGGHCVTDTVFIMQVPHDYRSGNYIQDLRDKQAQYGLPSDSVGFMTSAEVKYVFSTACEEADGERVFVAATAGVTNAVRAGDPLTGWEEKSARSMEIYRKLIAGTINIVAVVPHPMDDMGKINAMIPLVEGKAMAMHDMGYPETGTTSDAMAIVSPVGNERISFAGTGTPAGMSLARGVRKAVCECLHKRGESPYAADAVEILKEHGVDADMIWDCASALGIGEEQRDDFYSTLSDMASDQDICAIILGTLSAGYLADRGCICGQYGNEVPPVLCDGTLAAFLAGNISEDRGRDQTVDLLGMRPLKDSDINGYLEATVYGLVGGVVGYLTGYSDE